MKTATLYARFSPRPNGEQSESIELQFEKCSAYCLAHGYQIVGQYEDRELSGARADNRPGLQAAIEHCCRHKATLVVYSLSRLARNTQDALAIADRLQKCGANLALLDINMDTTTPTGRCVFTILAAVAELERNQIAQRTSDAMQRHQRNGKRMSRFAPVGFAIAGGTLVKDAAASAWRDMAVEMRSQGLSLRQIAQALQERSGRPFYATTVRKLLA